MRLRAPTLPQCSWMERPGADQRFRFGPYKGDTYGSVAVAETKQKADWIKSLRKTKPEKRAQYQQEFVRWMDERSTIEQAAAGWTASPSELRQDKVPRCEGPCDYKPTRGTNAYVIVSECVVCFHRKKERRDELQYPDPAGCPHLNTNNPKVRSSTS